MNSFCSYEDNDVEVYYIIFHSADTPFNSPMLPDEEECFFKNHISLSLLTPRPGLGPVSVEHLLEGAYHPPFPWSLCCAYV